MIIGLDVSTRIIGVCYMDNDGTSFAYEYIDLRKIDNIYEKADEVKFFINAGPEKQDDGVKIFIEDKLSGFAGGRTSQQTMMKLATFNGMVSLLWRDAYKEEPVHIHPSTIKATMKKDGLVIPKGIKGKDKKKITASFLKSIDSDFPYSETKLGNLKVGVDDMADAYCVARTGFMKGL